MIFSWQLLIMLILTCLFISWFLYRPIKSGLSQDESNIAINKQRQEELEIDINQGLIDDEQFQVAGSEIVNTLANELTNNNKASVIIKPINWSIAVFICLSALSIALYSQLSPKFLPGSQILSEPMTMNESIKKLQTFLEENPDDFQALKMMGLAQIGIGNVDDSIETLKRHTKLTHQILTYYFSTQVPLQQNRKGNSMENPKNLLKRHLISILNPSKFYIFQVLLLLMREILRELLSYGRKRFILCHLIIQIEI